MPSLSSKGKEIVETYRKEQDQCRDNGGGINVNLRGVQKSEADIMISSTSGKVELGTARMIIA